MNMKKLLIIGAPILVIIAILLGLTAHSRQTGSVQIIFSLPDQDNITATLNDKPLAITSAQKTYQLRTGSYKLVVKKPNYKDFTANFTVAANDSLVITASMQRAVATTPTTATAAIQKDMTNTLGDAQITGVTFFYNNTWAFITASSDGNGAYIVAHYDDVYNTWQATVGPGTLFLQSQLSGLPTDVVNYMQNNNYVAD